MVTKNIFSTQINRNCFENNLVRKVVFAAAMLTLSTWLGACSDVPLRSGHDSSAKSPFDNEKPQVVPAAKPGGGQSVSSAGATIEGAATGRRMAVILGPGGFKTFAHAGVIKELRKNNIPIDSIAGIEWGALVAGLYAQRGQIHEAEWKLYKLEKLDLNSTSFFSRKREAKSTKVLQGFLSENLGGIDAGQTATPFVCPSLNVSKGAAYLQKAGPLNRVVENCLGSPPMFTPQNDYVAALFSVEEVVRHLKMNGFNVIVLVNVLGDGNLFDKVDYNEDYATAVLWDEARREIWRARSLVTDVIDVTTQGISMSDFESRKVLVTAGEAAGEKAAHALAAKYGW